MEQRENDLSGDTMWMYIAATTSIIHDGTGRPLGMTEVDMEEASGPQHDGRTMFLANHLIPQASY